MKVRRKQKPTRNVKEQECMSESRGQGENVMETGVEEIRSGMCQRREVHVLEIARL